MGKFPIASLLRFRSAKRNLARLLAADGDFHSFAGCNKRVLEKDCFRQSLDAPYGKMSTPGAALVRLCSCRASGFVCTTSRPFSSLNNDVGVGKDDDAVVLGGNVILDDANGDRIKGGLRNGSDLGMVGEQPHKGEVGTSRGGILAVTDRDPVDLYKELCDAETYNNLEHSKWTMLQEVFSYFSKSGWASSQALAAYIGMSYFPTAARKFCIFFCDKCSSELAEHVLLLGPSDDAVSFLFPIFVEYCIEHFPDEIKRFKNMTVAADLTKPHTWFPFARAMKRKIIYHCGPTNSGKTYNALQRFMEAKKGIYCSPLRLLAMEVFDKVNAHGIYCSLLTGQEKKILPFSSHIACTIEMASDKELYDVAVIDEIQMMADKSRGYAWTRALLGLTADEIHLCGDPSVLNIVRKICSETGDELHEEHYERFKPLVVEEKTLMGDLKNVRSGDCVVVFSRREIFEVKMAIERYTKHRCCTIYGALPPETRRQQAHLFDDQDNEFDVLVASDAVGMGLNLNIRRVVFYNLSKYNGDKVVPVPASQIKQIAGRAGRRGSCYPHGLTTTLHKDDIKYLIQCLDPLFVEVKNVGLYPFFQQIELFAGQFPNMTLPQLLENFGESCRLDGSYFLCNYDHIKKVGNMLQKVQGLSLEDRFNFCFAPVNVRDPKAMHHLLKFALAYSQNHPVNVAMGMPKRLAKNDTELLELESKHQVCSMYLWLSNQYGEDKFPYKKRVETMATDIAERLGQSLIEANWMPEARSVRKPGPEIKKDGYERPHSLIKMRVKVVPLLDSKGNLAGTHRAISTQTGTSAGVGFATPSSTVPANSLAAKVGLLPITRGFAGNIILVAVDSKPTK